MLNCLLLAATCGCIGSVTSGHLIVESVPRRPQLTDHVILRCHASPTRVYFRLNCHFQWDWSAKEPPQPPADGRDDPEQALPQPPVTPWWKVSNQDVSEAGSVIVLDELRPEHQGRYVCRLSCDGRKKESVGLTLEIGEDSGQLVNEQNSKIAYLATAAIFGIIIMVTALRFFCANVRECRWVSKDNTSADNISSVYILQNQCNSRPQNGLSSIETVWLKEPSDRRPTILDENVWLPPYDAALRYPRPVHPSTTRKNDVCRPPTYEDALVALVQEPRNDSGRIQTV